MEHEIVVESRQYKGRAVRRRIQEGGVRMNEKLGIRRTLLSRDIEELREELNIATVFGEAKRVRKFTMRLLYLGLKGRVDAKTFGK